MKPAANMTERHRRIFSLLPVIMLFLITFVTSNKSLVHAQATFTPLGIFGNATDVSADGSVIVGTTTGPAGVFRMTPQGSTLRSTGISSAASVSADGSTVVGTFMSANGEEAFRWVGDGPLEGLGDLPGGAFQSRAFGVSGDGGVVVGTSQPDSAPTAFRWTAAGGMMELGGNEKSAWDVSADGSVVVGSLAVGAEPRSAYRWTAPTGSITLPPLQRPNLAGAEARAISADGSVVVGLNSFRFGLGGIQDAAFRWTAQQGTIELESGGWRNTIALDVSGDGSAIVGRGLDPATTSTGAFYWTHQTGMLSLRDLLIFGGATNLDGWQITSAEGISEDGRTVVGAASDSSGGSQAFVATIGAIPEPSTIVLAVFSAALLGLMIRRSMRSHIQGVGGM